MHPPNSPLAADGAESGRHPRAPHLFDAVHAHPLLPPSVLPV